jgi:hypothetical protein
MLIMFVEILTVVSDQMFLELRYDLWLLTYYTEKKFLSLIHKTLIRSSLTIRVKEIYIYLLEQI